MLSDTGDYTGLDSHSPVLFSTVSPLSTGNELEMFGIEIIIFETFKHRGISAGSYLLPKYKRMIPSLLLTVLLSFFVNVSCEKCRTNNDCGSGRCEWRRCVGKLGKVISDRMEIENCYVDDDCPIKQVCRGGSCQERLPLISDVVNVRPDHCYTDANCPLGFKCGFYKKCYNMSDGRYVVESFMHIPCKHEAPSFCAEATGFENAICREIYFEHENVRSYICQFPPPFMYAEHKSCDEKGGCSRYGTCIRGTCYQPFWVTVRQRCKSNDECTFRATCNSDGGCEEGRWALRYRTCRVSSECGNGGSGSVMRYVCRRFECTYRRSVPAECDACRFDEFCDLYENCLRVQRFSELNCDGDNWFYWYSAFYCSSTTEKTYKDALLECMELKAKLVYSPDRGSETSLSPENALLSYLAIRAGWVKEENDEIEKNFVNWNFDSEKMKKSRFFVKKKCLDLRFRTTPLHILVYFLTIK
ncbi:hypothetical protein LOAG_16771 [Loa loa]|uniref:Uncharacterized protein n=1 Tax=Loa loa TaxID=7209 RepID=A0A1S0UL88_LOALO|nr:hypothetical protein LOAG_16771 [Loa loa]EJD76241.1 hypothetical protein LOAG_16771 [Loa loa]